ncbi:NACHT, LRR and PYD domains-containing protein 12-like [Trichomycterus rosablanca]|uniref:NACHT, LRR and PYD domains-containing protein 12-like n=1 Tax=Trichomycterus rosablanca TaxID=2290929 RepID=UPI002F3570D0
MSTTRDDDSDESSEDSEPSAVSMKSHNSIIEPIRFSMQSSEDSEPSAVSMKSHNSIIEPIRFRNQSSEDSEPSAVSMKSHNSIIEPIRFSMQSSEDSEPSAVSMKSHNSIIEPIRFRNQRFNKYYTNMMKEKPGHSSADYKYQTNLKMLQKQIQQMHQTRQDSVLLHLYKSKLWSRFQRINEGIPTQAGISRLLIEVYTDLYITECGYGEVNNEHEVRCIERSCRRLTIQASPINCNDIFRSLPGQDRGIRTVLTKGIAGIGKTVSVQKFILDWAEGKANQDLDFIFPFPFRELNLMKGKRLSLVELVHWFFPETKQLNTDFHHRKVLFIFDGLDECRFLLDFQNYRLLSDLNESASVDVLLTNLIKGNLLPSALLWITSRPAAASQIAPDRVDRVTEVQGFSDPQKEEYFRKRISERTLADRIIAHLRSSRSLYIMCHMPVFCWITATVLERRLSEAVTGEIPKTLTQMFTHFLVLIIEFGTLKYRGKYKKDPHQTADIILKLGSLAFQQLKKGNLIFYEDDLRECGIDVREATVYSGVCTQIFIEEFTLNLGKMYSFVHLSVQEHIAAVYVFFSCINGKISGLFGLSRNTTLPELLKTAVDKALQSDNGHLDLFLRFLLGLSVESNSVLLERLLTPTGRSAHSATDTDCGITQYMKQKIHENPSEEKFINLFHCLNELNDASLEKEVQRYLTREENYRLRGVQLSPVQWSALVFVILNSDEELEVFNLKKYVASEECFLKLLPVAKASRRAVLCESNLTKKSCKALATILTTTCSCIKELDLSDNKLLDSGVQLLSAGLNSPCCKLEILRLGACGLTEKSCSVLASTLSLNTSCLRELRLSQNKLGDSGVKRLSEALQSPYCKLETLRLNNCGFMDDGFTAVIKALSLNPSHLKALNLGRNKAGPTGIHLLSDLLRDPHCNLETLKLFDCSITEDGSTRLISALIRNPSHLKELDLGWNTVGDSGMKLISDLLNKPQCKIDTLKLHDCKITDEGCAALLKVLSSNRSLHLRELDMSSNDIGDQAVHQLANFKDDENYRLAKLEI